MENKTTELIYLRNKVISTIVNSDLKVAPDLRDGNNIRLIINRCYVDIYFNDIDLCHDKDFNDKNNNFKICIHAKNVEEGNSFSRNYYNLGYIYQDSIFYNDILDIYNKVKIEYEKDIYNSILECLTN